MSREVRRVEESVEYSRSTLQVADEDPTHLPGAPLVTFDLHFDNLREFLNSVSQAVNQHAKVIRFLSNEVKTRVSMTELIDAMRILGPAVPDSLRDTALSSGKTLRETANDVAAGLKGLSTQVLGLNSHVRRTDVILEEQRLLINDRATHAEVKKAVKTAKKKVRDELKKKCSEIEHMMRDIEAGLVERFSLLEKKFAELELNTLWKLKDCEELLKVRVNEKYVWDAIKSLEDKLRRDLSSGQDIRHQALDKELKELRRDLEKQDKDHTHKTTKLKADLDDYEVELERRPKKEDVQRLQDQIDELKLNSGSSDLASKLRELAERLDKLTARFSSFKESLKKEGNSGLEDELSRLSRSIFDMTEKLARKVDLDVLNDLLSKLNSKGSAPVLAPPPIPASAIGEDEFNRFKEKVMEFIRNLEKRVERCVKDSDLKALAKKLDTKAEDERVNSEFNAQDYRINSHERNIDALSKEIEQMQAVLRKILGMLESSGSSSALASFKSLPNCLSCGRGDSKYAPMIPHIKGRDGRLYRADDRMSPSNTRVSFNIEDAGFVIGADVFASDTHQHAHHASETQRLQSTLSSETLRMRGSKVFGREPTSQSRSIRLRPQSAKK